MVCQHKEGWHPFVTSQLVVMFSGVSASTTS